MKITVAKIGTDAVHAAIPADLAFLDVDVVETALDAGLFLSVDGKRPDVPALREARELLEG